MSGICSVHRHTEPGCPACHAHPRDLFPDFDERLAEAEAAGEHKCECGFTYYRTVDSCPACYRSRLPASAPTPEAHENGDGI